MCLNTTIRYYSCGVESYNMRPWFLYSVTTTPFPLCLMTWMIGPRTCSGCATWVFTTWILTNVKGNVSLTSHEGSDRGWNVGHTLLFWHLSELGWQICQLHVPDALHPNENSLGIFSVRGWMHRRDTEFEQKWFNWKFSKDPQRNAPPQATVKIAVGFCNRVARE